MRKGSKASQEMIIKMRNSALNAWRRPEYRKHMSDVHKGKAHTKEQREKMSKAHKKRVADGKCHLYKDGRCKDKKYLSWINNRRGVVLKRVKNELGSHTFGEWELLKKQYNYTCPSCGLTETKIRLTEDHIIPLSKGGSDLIENIQPLCQSCNSKKHTKIIKYERKFC